MIHSAKFSAILDACVLYPASLRDTLLSLADQELYNPKWSAMIQEEWKSSLLKERPDLSADLLNHTVTTMNLAFPDADVSGFEDLISVLALPDPNDNHVLAASVKCGADVIVTMNQKDFPQNILSQYGIEVQHPDIFIRNLIELEPDSCLAALTSQVARLRNPTQTIHEVLRTLEKNALVQSVDLFRKMI